MLQATRTEPPGVRLSGVFEMSFSRRKRHEPRMERKQKCKFQYGSKTCTAEHSVREASRTQHDTKIVFFDTPYYLHSADSLNKAFGRSSLSETCDNSELKSGL